MPKVLARRRNPRPKRRKWSWQKQALYSAGILGALGLGFIAVPFGKILLKGASKGWRNRGPSPGGPFPGGPKVRKRGNSFHFPRQARRRRTTRIIPRNDGQAINLQRRGGVWQVAAPKRISQRIKS